MKRGLSAMIALAALFVSANAYSALNQEMNGLIEKFQKEAGIKAFSAEDGKKFFATKRMHSKGEERSCSTCHTADPRQKGKTVVGKVIEPMAQSMNKERFTDPKKVEKWLKRNCEWVLERECTPKEKGDFILYMTTI
ncbi:MAG: hypothetical protein A2X99_08815 [Deltaproteobacteria bacterium GWB2_55_19]|nr:MAG: hypothetical protein A2X99_08815 [Deltaproteobacteria bacterium GWB2_55_19]